MDELMEKLQSVLKEADRQTLLMAAEFRPACWIEFDDVDLAITLAARPRVGGCGTCRWSEPDVFEGPNVLRCYESPPVWMGKWDRPAVDPSNRCSRYQP